MQDLSGNFLYEFTKELILNSAPAYLRDKELDMQEMFLELLVLILKKKILK